MDLRRLHWGELLAGGGAVALLVLSFLPWYSTPTGSLTAWDAFGVTDVLIVLAVAPALVLVAATAAERTPALPVVAEVASATLALPAIVAIAIRLLDKPDHATSLQPASWLSLLAALAILGGAWRSMHDEHAENYAPTQAELRRAPV